MDETVNAGEAVFLPHRLPMGTVLRDRYQLQQVLGQGGFGITYRAWDHTNRIWVAVKEFFPQSIVTRDCTVSHEVRCITQSMVEAYSDSRARFLREARALEQLKNVRPIVGIQDYFEDNNTAYIVMEFIAGLNLKEYVLRRGGALSVEETLQILEPIFQALITVHRLGFVHRDISPDNILLDPREGARLLDFGAVRSVENPAVDKNLSTSTAAILKHGFAPVEQYHSRGSLGPWTDEYALCATVYYCLTGQVPDQVTLRITENRSPQWALIPGLQPNQQRALDKGMAIQPFQRFQDVEQLYMALYRGTPVPNITGGDGAVRPPQPAANPLKAVLIVLLVLILAAAAGFGVWKVVEASRDKDITIAHGGDEEEPERRPDGTEEVPPGPEEEEPEAPDQDIPEAPGGQNPEIPDVPASPVEEADTRWKDNVLTPKPLDALLQNSPEENIDDYIDCRHKIRSITFQDHLEGVPQYPIYLGEGGTDRVLGWVKWSGGYADIVIAAEGGMDGSKACRAMFAGCLNMTSLDFGGAFHTDGSQDMKWMFYGCRELVSLDVSCLDTSNVTMMQAMFRECVKLEALDVSGFDTSRVVNMSQIFSGCGKLEYLDLKNFDTSSAENMSYMFSNCHNLRNVNVSAFNTSRVKNMEGVFRNCKKLEDVELSWDISSVTNHAMFMEDGKTVNGRPWQEYFR